MKNVYIKMLFVLLSAISAAPSLAGGPEVSQLSYRTEDSRILVSFITINAFPPEIEQRLQSGLEVEFRHFVEIMSPRWYWWNAKPLRRQIQTKIKYDNLTKQYTFTKIVDGGLIESETTSVFTDIQKWMTSFQDINLGQIQDLGDGRFFIRAKTDIMKRNVFLFIPWDIDTGWKKIPLILKSNE